MGDRNGTRTPTLTELVTLCMYMEISMIRDTVAMRFSSGQKRSGCPYKARRVPLHSVV